ncbi:MAG: PRC-barrel domain-containing protein [Thermoleophilaceae bacterium]
MTEPQSSVLGAGQELVGSEVFDTHGERVGKLLRVFPGAGGPPELALVKTGLFGLRHSFVPLAGAALEGDALVVPFLKAHIREAPASADQEAEVFRHYGINPR